MPFDTKYLIKINIKISQTLLKKRHFNNKEPRFRIMEQNISLGKKIAFHSWVEDQGRQLAKYLLYIARIWLGLKNLWELSPYWLFTAYIRSSLIYLLFTCR